MPLDNMGEATDKITKCFVVICSNFPTSTQNICAPINQNKEY